MQKEMICIECPAGCRLKVDTENGKVFKVEGNKCPKGEVYACNEIENPLRFLTSTVVADGLSLKVIPVRIDRPIPKDLIFKVVEEIGKIRITKPVKIGEVLVKDLLGLGVDLIATRGCERKD